MPALHIPVRYVRHDKRLLSARNRNLQIHLAAIVGQLVTCGVTLFLPRLSASMSRGGRCAGSGRTLVRGAGSG
jgi:hypothetical protein